MSTRCNIEIYDDGGCSCLLYHHSDGCPEFMGQKLATFLEEIYQYLVERNVAYWWDGERVGALMVALSGDDYHRTSIVVKDVPKFQPCVRVHWDIDYLWKIYLQPDGKFVIEYDEV